MIPSAFVRLEALPRLPNGKIDLHSLPNPGLVQEETDETFAAPRTPAEQILADIWSDILGMDPINVHDNFFEIGGDSILSIQIIARARDAGLQLAPNHLFEFQTLAELALAATPSMPTLRKQTPASGPVPLTPIQHWFFDEHPTAPHHWNQAVLFALPPGIQPDGVKQALMHLMHHHDGLRLGFKREANTWNAAISEPNDFIPFQVVSLPDRSQKLQERIIQEQIEIAQASLELSKPPLLRALYFEQTSSSNQLVLILHHLITDVLSWNILIEDLATAYQQYIRHETITLSRGTSSFKQWADRLATFASSEALLTERSFWQTQLNARRPLPTDFEAALPLTESSTETHTLLLGTDDTEKLLNQVNGAYNTTTEEVLLAALARVLVQWTGHTTHCIGLEHHGRSPEFEGVDLSRTVGWLTSYFPIALSLVPNLDPGSVLKAVKEQRRAVPNQGLGYGVLRYMSSEPRLPEVRPQVIFNYLGNQDQARQPLGWLTPVQAGTRHPESERFHLFEINAIILQGRLQVVWTYSRVAHQAETVALLTEAFMSTLHEFIIHCTAPGTGGYTPLDFPEAGLSQDDLDQLLGRMDK
jgi:non-ribosomal peptide synthase protein (TIGR01720 family)